MDIESTLSSITELFRETLYDILGLFVPGAALVMICHEAPVNFTRQLVAPITAGFQGESLALFIGSSYVLGYAVQGAAGYVWQEVVVPILDWRAERKRLKALTPEERSKQTKRPDEPGMKGVSPAGLQTKREVENSELYKTLKRQMGEYLGTLESERLSINEVQNMCYSVAGTRSANAFTFSFRADLCNGMFIVFVIGVVINLLGLGNPSWKEWLIRTAVYLLLATAFFIRAKFYFNIRGRIIFSIGLATLAELRKPKLTLDEPQKPLN